MASPSFRASRVAAANRNGSKRGLERAAVAIMLWMAWAWVMVFLGIVFYHGYQHRSQAKTIATTTTRQTESMDVQRKASSVLVPAKQIHDDKATFILLPHESPLLIFTCQRANYLRETLADVLRYIPQDCKIGCPVIISQDGNNPEVTSVITEFKRTFRDEKNIELVHFQHKSTLRRGSKSLNSYQALAIHYGWALSKLFSDETRKRVIILEEDLHIAPDFFGYFASMAEFLERDETLLAVSAFNDNGFEGMVRDAHRVLRSDFFPGLGWMMTRSTYESLGTWAPNGYWDDWLREPPQRRNRQVLRPEISRTFHFGSQGGASNNMFGDRLTKIHLNSENVQWIIPEKDGPQEQSPPYSYLRTPEAFDQYYWTLIEKSQLVDSVSEALEISTTMNARIEYTSHEEFQKLAKRLDIMDDEKAGIHRTEYKKVVETRPHGEFFIFLTPPWKELVDLFADVAHPNIDEK
jgi:alpha-1,3-mannosyl-glycoprotein beta-1,2-N-acetylglucosaminyltransferase